MSTSPDVRFDGETVRSLLDEHDWPRLAQLVREQTGERVVGVLRELPIDEATIVFRLLEKTPAVRVFDRLDPGLQAHLVSELADEHLAEVIGDLDPEEQARLLDEVPAKVAKRMLATLGPERTSAAMTLLGYAPDSIGRRMSPAAVHARPEDTLGEVSERICAFTGPSEEVASIPVMSAHRRLMGMVDVTELLRHPDHTLVAEVMAAPLFATTSDDRELVARRTLDAGATVLPIVDREDRLVGILPIKDAARIDREAIAQDQARAGASEPLARPYLVTPVLALTRARVVWLLVLALSGVLTVNVLEIFEAELSEQVALALFIPLLTGIGGNTGSQAATTVTRALSLGEVRKRDVLRVAFKEVRTGLLLGLLLAVLAFAAASVVYGLGIGSVVALTLAINCPIAATVGGVIPLVARACKVDPAVFSTPFISTFCDASGLLVYFTVALVVLGL
ncbi:magnesium transporter [Aeromicrobium phragmitis]|uniref:Magnesium transporter MgtE n=1 Tax=Aeromicrobium phragmitis TaxID=2478914 RepID=A0A3L8PN84_9ACTN|nr:magnesium transporter [Aeromicrobium phragmitis]RLV56760.1 magnesium transporter [Aeromicrobium phragmitis]